MKHGLFYFLFALLAVVTWLGCSPTSEVNFPKLEFIGMSPSDTLKSDETIAINFRLKDADANPEFVEYVIIYPDIDTSAVRTVNIPKNSLLSYQDIDMTLYFNNGQSASSDASFEITRNEGKSILKSLGYNVKIKISVIDEYNNKSNEVFTPLFFITGR